MTSQPEAEPQGGPSSMRWITVLGLSLTCGACSGAPLNSDAIRARYGSYSVDVIAQSATQRVAVLRSGFETEAICRTLALTHFADPIPAELLSTHERIVAGGSIGETIRNAGFVVTKRDSFYFKLSAGALFEQLSRQTVAQTTPLLAQIYRLSASTAKKSIPYAVIIEIYHPDYRSLEGQDMISRGAIAALDPSYRTAVESLSALWGDEY
jgi:hypothetical protein